METGVNLKNWGATITDQIKKLFIFKMLQL